MQPLAALHAGDAASSIQELAAHLSDAAATSSEDEWNPPEFWRENEQKYKRLALIALQVLPATATTASVERVFSKAGILLSSRRLSTGDEVFEKRLILTVNRHLNVNQKASGDCLKRKSVSDTDVSKI